MKIIIFADKDGCSRSIRSKCIQPGMGGASAVSLDRAQNNAVYNNSCYTAVMEVYEICSGENACELLAAAHNALAKAEGESETISQPHRGARRNAETTEATDSTHSAVRKG